jgi:molybdate transport system substrate-binding protein
MRPALTASTVALLALTIGGCGSSVSREPVTLTISVAASLQNAMNELAQLYERSHTGVKLNYNFGASGALEQQIESGAPADIFFSAAPKPMDKLASKSLILPDTRRDLLQNKLVLVVPKNSAGPNSFQELADEKVKLIALGEPSSVPAGDYGRQVLEALHVWAAVQPKLVLAKDVRQVLSYVETGNTEAGIVYATDAHESDRVRVAATAPPGSHTPVVYPVAVVKNSRNAAEARAFLTFLSGRDAGAVFTRHGFTTVAP